MTKKNIFDFKNYKSYLTYQESAQSAYIRGFRTRLAEVAGCNNAFISQVLNTGAHLSLEQALKISRYLSHDKEEEQYFIMLIEWERAGTLDLQNYFAHQLHDLKEKRLNIKTRVKYDKGLSLDAQATYYSQWYYAAIHMIVTISEFRTADRIAKNLKLNLDLVKKVIAFLVSHELIVEKEGELRPGPSYLHLEKSSPLIARHHSNWRLVAMDSLTKESKTDIHYSTVSTLSKKDVEILRAKCVQFIEEYVQIISHSKEEKMWVLNLDFFNMADG